ncbi:MAG TPA: THUMP domain-containing protein [Gemmataceae bacterium]
MSVTRYFATCARGLEPILADELHALQARDVIPGRGGVAFAGGRALLYKANLWLRTAVRVLRPVLEAPVTSPQELYAAVQTIDWAEFLTPDHTLAVDCNVRDSRITHSQYAARVVKDAICDQFVARRGRRPSVDPERPMVGLNLHVYKNDAVLSLDSSWDSLHKRGYRPVLTKAPLNEALAAALVLRTGWRGGGPFADPLCGSGTLPIEAAWIALSRPPGLTRRHFGFMGWMDYDVRLWTRLRDEARQGVGKRLDHAIVGSDERRDAVEHSRTNARAAGVGHLVRFDVRDVRDFTPPGGPPGALVCNPPYGERIGEEKDLRALYRTLGDVFRRLPGWAVWVFTGNPRLAALIDLPRAEEVPLFNGKIPCRFIRFQTG